MLWSLFLPFSTHHSRPPNSATLPRRPCPGLGSAPGLLTAHILLLHLSAEESTGHEVSSFYLSGSIPPIFEIYFLLGSGYLPLSMLKTPLNCTVLWACMVSETIPTAVIFVHFHVVSPFPCLHWLSLSHPLRSSVGKAESQPC